MIKDILLAEDDRGTALLVKTQLERHGYRVTVAQNGREALDIARSQDIQLIITDVVMPEMDGVDLYMELKKGVQTQNIPVIIVTDKHVFKESFSALGVEHFIPKSSDISLLLDKVKEAEKVAPVSRKYTKILIGGESSSGVDQIKTLLLKAGCLVSTADSSADLISKAFTMKPHIVLLDVGMKDVASTEELICSMRCFHFLKDSAVLTYSHISVEQIGQGQMLLDALGEEIKKCEQAGANKYLGRFNKITFLEQLEEFGVVKEGVLSNDDPDK